MAAEMLASMYDASLDAIKPHDWTYYLYNDFNSTTNYQHSLEGISESQSRSEYNLKYFDVNEINYDRLYLFNMSEYLQDLNTYAWRGTAGIADASAVQGKLAIKFAANNNSYSLTGKKNKNVVTDSIKISNYDCFFGECCIYYSLVLFRFK